MSNQMMKKIKAKNKFQLVNNNNNHPKTNLKTMKILLEGKLYLKKEINLNLKTMKKKKKMVMMMMKKKKEK